ncbi:hypothetical protein CAPTEDRAFT_221406 [Capitella teleta]|uniref:EGF-like domain-containing protein n=1 Tax=Capitella teleta TaxID=283909 RepID=R7V1D5_CAPTE|nr:hypothetical protein CAPTEDRAFT_221406 [Capitella teleta]|eukprot:ELU10017.1 hypothetical protein CAPTEDRAFT_221406 [Capitella teleta]
MAKLAGICIFISVAIQASSALLTHEKTLLWTEKAANGEVRIAGLPGDPEELVSGGKIRTMAQAYPADPLTRKKSHRIALAFLYHEKRLLFSDRGFKQIYKIQLQEAPSVPFQYNVTTDTVFAGISTEVNGLAVDWVSGNLYWTDALYNWISVSRTEDNSVYRHLITTGLDNPQGIAVYPEKGWMFWADWGANPRIERASLGGEDRANFVSRDIVRPIGVSVGGGRVYWVDDAKDTVESVDLNGNDRKFFTVDKTSSFRHNLFGISVFKNVIFVTDQWARSVNAYNRSSEAYLGRFVTQATPYDVMVYDGELQQSINSKCRSLRCEHMCITERDGGGHCICGQNYELNTDGQTCSKLDTFLKPQYIYSVGTSLCGLPIHAPGTLHSEDARTDVHCFLNNTGQMEALAFDADADWLFFSDTSTGTLSRMRLEDGQTYENIHLNRGDIRGIAVDWLSSNVYWTDESLGHIMVSRFDGADVSVLMSDIQRPRGIAVNPTTGLMYWSSGGNIYSASMDGTNVEVFVGNDLAKTPDGLVLDPTREVLLWADTDGLHSIWLNGSSHDFFAWTNGKNVLHFSHNEEHGSIASHQHYSSPVSYGIITYDSYLQPLQEGPCDDENGGCEHICLPTPAGSQCRCAVGFYLHSDGKSCMSDLWTSNFIIFLEPYHRRIFQLHLGVKEPNIHGIDTSYLQDPTHVAYDQHTNVVYWYERTEKVINYAKLTEPQISRTLISLDNNAQALDVSSRSGRIFFVDDQSIFYVQTTSREPEVKLFYTSKNRIELNTLVIDDKRDFVHWAEVTAYRETTIFKAPASSSASNIIPETVTIVRLYLQGISIDVEDESSIYYWAKSVIMKYSFQYRREVVLLEENNADYTKVFMDGSLLYINDANTGSVIIYNTVTKAKEFGTDQVFSQITDMKIIKGVSKTICGGGKRLTESGLCVEDNPNVLPNIHKDRTLASRTYMIIGGACAAFVILAAIVVASCCAVKRRTRKRTRKASTQPPHRTPAHDNPTYMTPEEAGARPVTVVTTSSPQESHVYEHLPELESGGGAAAPVFITMAPSDKDDIDIGPEMKPEVDLDMDIASEEAPISAISDSVNLVDNEEVSVQVQDSAVAYKP